MAEGLADVTVGPLVCRVAVVGGVGHRVGALGLSRAVLGVVEVEAVADVAEETRRRLLLLLGDANEAGKRRVPCEGADCKWRLFFCVREGTENARLASHPSPSSLPLNSARASFFSLIFSSSFFLCRSTMTLFRKLIWGRGRGHG